MKPKTPYKKRPVRFLELYKQNDWQIKIYSISIKNEFVEKQIVAFAKQHLTEWLNKSNTYPLETYKVATLILHEGKEGCFAIFSWWIDENMLQLFVYLAPYDNPSAFTLYSDKGIVSCVWEMAVLWFERNAWVENILMKADKPDIENYLKQQLNADV